MRVSVGLLGYSSSRIYKRYINRKLWSIGNSCLNMVSKRQKQLFIGVLRKHFSEAFAAFLQKYMWESALRLVICLYFKFEKKKIQNAWRLLLERGMMKTEEILRNMGIAGSVFRVAPNKYTPWTQDVNWIYGFELGMYVLNLSLFVSNYPLGLKLCNT